MSPGGPPLAPGMPLPRRANWLPGCVPGGSSISRSPSWLGTLTFAPSIASTAEISTWWIRSWPRIGPRRASKPKPLPKKAWKMSSTEPKPACPAAPAPRSPSCP